MAKSFTPTQIYLYTLRKPSFQMIQPEKQITGYKNKGLSIIIPCQQTTKYGSSQIHT